MLTSPGEPLAPPRPERAEPPVTAAPPLRGPAAARPAVPSVSPTLAPASVPSLAPAATPAALSARVSVPAADEPKGCLYALSQPPLMLFLCVISGLIGAGAAWDLLFVG